MSKEPLRVNEDGEVVSTWATIDEQGRLLIGEGTLCDLLVNGIKYRVVQKESDD